MKKFEVDMNKLSMEELTYFIKLIESGKINEIGKPLINTEDDFEIKSQKQLYEIPKLPPIMKKKNKVAQKFWGVDEIKKAITMKRSGVSTSGIAEELNRTKKSILNIIRKYERKENFTRQMIQVAKELDGVTLKHKGRKRKKKNHQKQFTEKEIESILDMKNKNVPYKKIAKKHNRTVQCIYSLVSRIKNKTNLTPQMKKFV